jgi:signal transduction histidine kinase
MHEAAVPAVVLSTDPHPAEEAGSPRPEASPRPFGSAGWHLDFVGLLSRLSAAFIHAPPEAVDGKITWGLRQVVAFLGIDRSSIAQFTDEGRQLWTTHTYSAPGIEPFPRVNLVAALPWYADQIRRGEVLRFDRLPEDLPPEAVREREYCRQSGFRAHLVIPFHVGKRLIGGLAFGTFHRLFAWPNDLVRCLTLVGEVFANALERKQAEERAGSLRDQVIRMDRVTHLGELAASIAHEVNQPLCAIVSNAQALQRLRAAGACEPDDLEGALADIIQAGQRAAAILDRIRGLIRQAPVDRAPVAVNPLLQEAAALVRGDLARRGVALTLDLAENLPPVLGDPVQFQQVVLNLLANGADAMDRVAREFRTLTLRSAADGGGVAVAVTDAGVGVPPEDLARIFRPFVSTKPGSMGMGLAVCRSIVEAHGGRLQAMPNPDHGMTFRFTVPAAPGGAA